MPSSPERMGEVLRRHIVTVGFAFALAILAGIAAFSHTSIKGFNEGAAFYFLLPGKGKDDRA
jgi:hypothetical protein